MSRVLVTGGAGTIGRAVVARLLAESRVESVLVVDQVPPRSPATGFEVRIGDLRDPAVARAAVRGRSHVIHLAAIVGGIANFHRQPQTLLAANTTLLNTVFDAAIAEGIERLVYVSSSMVFERAFRFPTPEEHLLECPTPRSAYGFSKLAGEVMCRAAHAEHGLEYTICRPFNAYGPGEMPADEPGIAHVVPDLLRKSLARQRPLEIFGSGEQTRTLTHVDDIAEGIVRATFHPRAACEDFNISASEELMVAEIARICWEACGNDPADFELRKLPSFEVDVERRWPAVDKAKRLLGFEARIPVVEGIRATADWLRQQLAVEAQ